MKKEFWYVATPYSQHPYGMEHAFEEASRAAATLLGSGVNVFCPIAHTHPLAIHGGLDPLGHDFWLPADQPFMDAAIGLIVVKMLGWKESFGVGEEIREFTMNEKPVLYMDWHERPPVKSKKLMQGGENVAG